MEKFYLSSIDDIDYNKRIELVEITYSRKAPSFGVVYVSSRTNKLQLKALEFGENHEAYFADLKRSQEPNDGSIVLNYDIHESLSWDGNEDSLQCVVLTSGRNSLYRCQLMKDGALIELEIPSSSRNVIFRFCRLNCDGSQSYIHILSDKSYLLMRFEATVGLFEPVNKYSLLDSKSLNHLIFTGLHLFPSNVEYALLELSDRTWRIINGKTGDSLINLDLQKESPSTHLHMVLPGDNSSNSLLISYSQDSLTAHCITLNPDTSRQADPDGLLVPSKNSLELEECWTIDFRTIEGVTLLDEDERDEVDSGICLASLWSSQQISAIHASSKYLVAGRGPNLLVYSFESSSPFPLVYDRFFMKDSVSTTSNQVPPMIDQKCKPTLVQNFKFTGTQTTDALWNTIFHAAGSRANLVVMRHFQQMGILAALTNNGHLLCFRFDSDEIPAQRNNLYHQQVTDSIRGSSGLLLNTIEMLQDSNKNLKQDISEDSTRVNHEKSQKELANLVSATLTKRSDIGAMYSLTISVSDLIQLSQIVITSSVNSSFMNATVGASFIESLTIDNSYSSRERGILLADADPESSVFQQKDAENIMTSVLIDLKPNLKNVSLHLSVFMIDGKCGKLKIHCLMNDGREDEQSPRYLGLIRDTRSSLYKDYQEVRQTSAFTLMIHLRTLHSYQQSNVESPKPELLRVLRVTGSFLKAQMLSWLDKCIVLPLIDSSKDVDITLFSNFTYCFIKIKLQDEQLELSSDDMFARELIRKLILEEATDNSIKLDTTGSQGFDEEGLNHLLRLQHRNLEIISRMHKQSEKGESQTGNESQDLLLELLKNEMSLSEFTVDFKVPPEEETIDLLKKDIENELRSSLAIKSNKSMEFSNGEETSVSVFRSLVCGYIVDCLADFNKFQGFKVDEERLESTQAKLIQLLLEDSALSMDSFVTRVHSAWKSSGT